MDHIDSQQSHPDPHTVDATNYQTPPYQSQQPSLIIRCRRNLSLGPKEIIDRVKHANESIREICMRRTQISKQLLNRWKSTENLTKRNIIMIEEKYEQYQTCMQAARSNRADLERYDSELKVFVNSTNEKELHVTGLRDQRAAVDTKAEQLEARIKSLQASWLIETDETTNLNKLKAEAELQYEKSQQENIEIDGELEKLITLENAELERENSIDMELSSFKIKLSSMTAKTEDDQANVKQLDLTITAEREQLHANNNIKQEIEVELVRLKNKLIENEVENRLKIHIMKHENMAHIYDAVNDEEKLIEKHNELIDKLKQATARLPGIRLTLAECKKAQAGKRPTKDVLAEQKQMIESIRTNLDISLKRKAHTVIVDMASQIAGNSFKIPKFGSKRIAPSAQPREAQLCVSTSSDESELDCLI